MNTDQLLEYIMYTPLQNLPPMPESIQNENNIKLGVVILEMLKEDKIKINNMDKNGFLHISIM